MIFPRRSRHAGVACAAALALGCAAPARRSTSLAPTPPPARAEEPRIRVCLAEAVERAQLAAPACVLLRTEGVDSTLEAGPLDAAVRDDAIELRRDGKVVARAGQWLDLGPCLATGGLAHEGTPYRGALLLRRVGARLIVINELPLEIYLRGVLPWEIGSQDAAARAAVEAQAIAARTYAFKRLGKYPESGFDVYADVMDQVYRGTQREDTLANRAIDVTRGCVLWNAAGLVEAYYCSTCGGHTSRLDAVWNKPPEPALRGRRDAPPEGVSYCQASRHFRWSEAWSGAGLEQKLQQTLPRALGWPQGRSVGGLLGLSVAERDETGRVRELRIRTSAGVFRIFGDRIRWILQPQDRPILRSTLFTLEVERSEGRIVRVVVRGGGNGHGVGMCQMGALEMSRQGRPHAEILSHYYTGSSLVRLY